MNGNKPNASNSTTDIAELVTKHVNNLDDKVELVLDLTNHMVGQFATVDAAMQSAIQQAFINIIQTPEGLEFASGYNFIEEYPKVTK